MSKMRFAASFVAFLSLLPAALGDQWQEAKSFEKLLYNGLIRVKVVIPKSKGEHPTAKIERRENGAYKHVCSGSLVNELRPVDLFVSEDGHSVVTTDEWKMAGYQHALVFYKCSRDLALQKEYGLEDFLTPQEIEKFALSTMSSRNWEDHSDRKVEDGFFVVTLKSGRAIRFSLADASLVRKTAR